MNYLTIGEVAKRSNVTVEAIRFYEKKNLLSKPNRTASGYRQYTDDTVKRIQFIQRAKVVGFSLKEIHELLTLKEDLATSSGDIKNMAAGKISDIDERIQVLNEIRNALTQLSENCDNNSKLGETPVLECY